MNRTRRITLTGMLAAAALVLSALEGLLIPAGILPPGVKPGLSNIMTMFAAFSLGFPAAAAIACVKAVFALITRGGVAGLLSFCGGLSSAAVISIAAFADKKHKLGFLGVSISGAVTHNVGQLGVAALLISPAVFAYGPVLLLSACLSGSVTSLLLKTVWPYMKRLETGVRTKYMKNNQEGNE